MGRRGGLVLAAALLTVILSGCSNGAERSREEWTTLYQQAIMVEYNPVISAFDEETAGAGLALESLGLQEEDVEAFGASVSVMNTQAYAIAAVQPAQDREENVREALQGYIDRQQSNFQFYLPDQYQVAQNARLETLSDGTVLLVMCQDADNVFDSIRAELEQA